MWAQFGQLLKSALLFSLKQGLEFFLLIDHFISRVDSSGLVKRISRSLERLLLLVTLFNLFIVLEVGEELAPCNELLVIDGVLLLR